MGVYDGWSARYDEWIPMYSPRIQAHLSHSNNLKVHEIKFDANFDCVHLQDKSGLTT